MLNGSLAGSGPKAQPSSIRLTGAARSSSGASPELQPAKPTGLRSQNQLGRGHLTDWAEPPGPLSAQGHFRPIFGPLTEQS
jgi:hypothetical protein